MTLLESTDGAETFSAQPIGSLSDEVPHADQHAMAWDPKVPNRVYLGNDGGVYRSDENGAAETWRFGDYQPFSQLYTLDVSAQDPARKVAGLQDNGSIRSWGDGGQWNEYLTGDGQRTLIKPTDQNVVYACYQYGECAVSTDGGENMEYFTEKVVSARKNWTTPIEFDPEDPETIYTGGEIMNTSEDQGQTFVPISPDLSNGPGKETNPLFRNYGTLTTIAPAGKSTGTIYAGTDDGNLWYTHDQSNPSAWTKADDVDPPKAWITRVEVDRRDPQVAYVSYSGFRSGDDAAYVLRTTDGGASWDDITGDLPHAPVNDINVIGDSVFVASDFGVFATRDAGATWLKVGRNLPLAPIFELRHHAATNRLYAGTFGRSIWSIDLAELDKAPAQDGPTAEI
nr:glycosyl hydrolase [Actinomycetota bacterium]